MKRLPPELQARILRKIRELLSVNPHIGTPLRGELAGVLSVRIGDWRVLYEVDDKNRTVALLYVAHRRRVYRG